MRVQQSESGRLPIDNDTQRRSSDAVFYGRALQKDPTLKQFEVAQLANLCPSDAEEAKALIPRSVSMFCSMVTMLMPATYSLASRDDDALQLILNELAALRRFQ